MKILILYSQMFQPFHHLWASMGIFGESQTNMINEQRSLNKGRTEKVKIFTIIVQSKLRLRKSRKRVWVDQTLLLPLYHR